MTQAAKAKSKAWRVELPTPAGAIVMSLGVFSVGVMHYFTGGASVWDKTWVVLTALVWLYLFVGFGSSVLDGSYHSRHADDSLNRFAIGTWVAGTSAATVAVVKSFPGFKAVAWLVVILNVVFWMYYVIVAARGARQLTKNRGLGNIHGVILLPAVAAQSLVLLLTAEFGTSGFVLSIEEGLAVLGAVFYALSAAAVLYRYFSKPWDLADDWNNTNCMLHGAASISGAAALQVHLLRHDALAGVWIYSLCMLVLVEGLEIVRAVLRNRRYGWKEGIGVYQVTQWTRLFTLGMFYFFTLKAQPSIEQGHPALGTLAHYILAAGGYLLTALLAAEGALMLSESRREIIT